MFLCAWKALFVTYILYEYWLRRISESTFTLAFRMSGSTVIALREWRLAGMPRSLIYALMILYWVFLLECDMLHDFVCCFIVCR